MSKRIATLHYIRLLSDSQMLSVDMQTFPPEVLEESVGGERVFPKHCPKCGSDELKFSRVEEWDEAPGHKLVKAYKIHHVVHDHKLVKAYKIHHVICVKCSEEGPLEHFQ